MEYCLCLLLLCFVLGELLVHIAAEGVLEMVKFYSMCSWVLNV